MRVRVTGQAIGIGFMLLSATLSGCHKAKQKSPAAMKAETKRQQAACSSPVAYDRLKNSIFDEAIAKGRADQSKLDMLADYSVARMENPIVRGWDQSLDVTKCEGRFILEVPPGAEPGLGGTRQLQADIKYTAQPSADGSGLVYRQEGADAIVARLASFDLGVPAFRPPPAIDQEQAASTAEMPVRVQTPQRPLSAPSPNVAERSWQGRSITKTAPPAAPPETLPTPTPRTASAGQASGGEEAVRGFYAALGAGNGIAAASHVVPEKRSGPFSPSAISRFYGRLPERLRLTSLTPAGGAYRVTYRYSAGRSHCNGVAVVRLTNRDGHNLISSIRSLSGC